MGEIVVCLLELLPLIMLADKSLHDADGNEVFLDIGVHGVQLLLHEGEQLIHEAHKGKDAGKQHRHRDEVDQRQLPAVGEYDYDGDDQLKRRLDERAHHHLNRHLELPYVAGGAGDQAGGGKAVDIAEGKLLDVAKHRLAKVRAETVRRAGGVPGAQKAGDHADDGQRAHHDAAADDIAAVRARYAHIHDVRHQGRKGEGDERFQQNEYGRQEEGIFVFPPIPGQDMPHLTFCSFYSDDIIQIIIYQ